MAEQLRSYGFQAVSTSFLSRRSSSLIHLLNEEPHGSAGSRFAHTAWQNKRSSAKEPENYDLMVYLRTLLPPSEDVFYIQSPVPDFHPKTPLHELLVALFGPDFQASVASSPGC